MPRLFALLFLLAAFFVPETAWSDETEKLPEDPSSFWQSMGYPEEPEKSSQWMQRSTSRARCKDVDLEKFDSSVRQPSGFGDADKKPILSNTHPGILAVIRDEKDLVFSARKPTAAELAEAEKLNVDLVCTPFGRDALVFVQNHFNPVRNLTLEPIQRVVRTGGYVPVQSE